MKLASKIMGGVVIAIFIVVICFTFIGSKSVFNSSGQALENNQGGSIDETLTGGLAMLLALFGTLAYFFMIFIGVVLCLFLLSFCVHYIMRLKTFDPPNIRLLIIQD